MENSYLRGLYDEQQLQLFHHQQLQQYEDGIIPVLSSLPENNTIDLTVFMKEVGDKIDNGIQQLLSYHWTVSIFFVLSLVCLVVLFVYNMPLRFAINCNYHTLSTNESSDDDDDDDNVWNATERLLLKHYRQHHRMHNTCNSTEDNDNDENGKNNYDPYGCAVELHCCCCYDDFDDDNNNNNNNGLARIESIYKDVVAEDQAGFVRINIEAAATSILLDEDDDDDINNNNINNRNDDSSYHYKLMDEQI